jgi:prolyl-tRNA editing enzyme YbaK/EbsC (Cys-tRNA(Pro) deacylase)
LAVVAPEEFENVLGYPVGGTDPADHRHLEAVEHSRYLVNPSAVAG